MTASGRRWLLLALVALVVGGVSYVVLHPGIGFYPSDESKLGLMPSPYPGVASSAAPHAQTESLRDARGSGAIDPSANTTESGDQRTLTNGILSGLAQQRDMTLVQAIGVAIAKHGSSDPRVAEVVSSADALCGGVLDPRDATNPAAPDETRAWAVKRLVDVCRGFDKNSYELDPPQVSDAGYTKMILGDDAAVQQAFHDIATAHRFFSLVRAGTVLFETGAFPYTQVLPGVEQYGLADLNLAWNLAVGLVLCREQGPCGPWSIQVASFCSMKGCLPGSDLQSAYRRDLPAFIYHAVIAFADWMVIQRAPYS